MPLTRVVCPSCQAGLKSAAGFKPRQKLRCPKCQGIVTVPAPVVEVLDDEMEDKAPPPPKPSAKSSIKKIPVAANLEDDDEEQEDRPVRKKKKKKGGSYKSSPIRFVILGVLFVVLGVMGYMLFLKKATDKETIAHNEKVKAKQGTTDEGDEPAPIASSANPKGKGTYIAATAPPEQRGDLMAFGRKLIGNWKGSVTKLPTITAEYTFNADGTFQAEIQENGQHGSRRGTWDLRRLQMDGRAEFAMRYGEFSIHGGDFRLNSQGGLEFSLHQGDIVLTKVTP